MIIINISYSGCVIIDVHQLWKCVLLSPVNTHTHAYTHSLGKIKPKGKAYLICILSLSVSLSHKIPYTLKHALKLSVYTICCSQPPPHAGAHWHGFSCPPLHVPTGRVQHGSFLPLYSQLGVWFAGDPTGSSTTMSRSHHTSSPPSHPLYQLHLICHALLYEALIRLTSLLG